MEMFREIQQEAEGEEENRDVLREWLNPHGLRFLITIFTLKRFCQNVNVYAVVFVNSVISFLISDDRLNHEQKKTWVALLQWFSTFFVMTNFFENIYPLNSTTPAWMLLLEESVPAAFFWLRGEYALYKLRQEPEPEHQD